jgi:dienelactone hydrolase
MRRVLCIALLLAAARLLPPLAAQAPPKDVTPQAQGIVDLLVKQDFAKVFAQFTPAMRTAMPEERLRDTWLALVAQFGAFKEQRGVRLETRGDMRVAVVTIDFERAAIDMQLAFNPAGLLGGWGMRPYAPPASYSSPPYDDATKYTETDVTVGGADWPLPGTLTMPNGPGPFAAVVLVHGSGPNDRDESVGPNKTFKDLALGLASRGIAVLRYDKRSKVFGARLAAIKYPTVKDEVVDDALSAVAQLRKTPKIDPARIVVLGHSLGGMLIPRIGAADARVAGLISMAGATRQLEYAMLEQTQYLAAADGRVTPDEQKVIDAMEALVKTVAALTPADAPESKPIQGVPASYWLDLRGYDPATAAQSLKQPLLILQGERDYQVTMGDDFAKWKAALGSKPGVTFRTYPALNHLFLPGTGKSVPAEYETPGHVPADVISDIAAWIAALM